eukprot:7137552-Prymnesium_polylepis.1
MSPGSVLVLTLPLAHLAHLPHPWHWRKLGCAVGCFRRRGKISRRRCSVGRGGEASTFILPLYYKEILLAGKQAVSDDKTQLTIVL